MKKTSLLPFLLLFFSLLAPTQNVIGQENGTLLDPAQAFRTTARVDDEQTLQVQIDIADGYYVYREKIRITSAGAVFNELILPDGTRKTDEFFGEVETYRGELNFSSKIENLTATGSLSVTVQSQGCADIGVCYPPFTQKFIVEIPATSEPTPLPKPTLASPFSGNGAGSDSGGASSSVLPGFGSSLIIDNLASGGEDEILDPEVAFTVITGQPTNGVIPVSWQIADGYYLYRDKFQFEVTSPATAQISGVEISKGKLKHDEFFGEVEVHRSQATALVSIANLQDANQLTLQVGYQGCADVGICYPPQSKEIQVPLAASGNTNQTASTTNNSSTLLANTSSDGAPLQERPAVPVAQQDRLAASLMNDNRWFTILTFFGMGLLLTFTPCVLPMIPILSSIIVGSGENISTRRAFSLSLVYVLAMALTYTIAGVVVGLTGENIQATLQHPYVLSAFAILFVFLAASMFGMFELQMPAFMQNRLTTISNKQKSGSFSGVAMMGFLSALIVGPCITAPLVGALIYIGQTGDAVLGGAALFALSMGMGMPLLIIGTSFGKYLPTAGPWMDTIKNVFGVLLLGVAIWMLDRVIPAWATMALTALLFIIVGMFLGAFEPTSADAKGWHRVAKGIGYTSLVYGTLLIIGVATGSGTLLKPLLGLSTGNQAAIADNHVTFRQVKGVQNLDVALASAQAQNKPVILDFYADWCVSCKEMEAFTFTDPVVAQRMKQAVLLQVDVTANDDSDKAVLKKYGIYGPPAIMFYDTNGVEQKNARVVGFVPAQKFARHLELVL